MKKILSVVLFAIILAMVSIPCSANYVPTAPPQQEEVTMPEDSTVEVIGWFSKNDSVVYNIQQGQWRITKGDTIQTAEVTTKVLLTVTNETENGYKMNYTFLDFFCDTVADSPLSKAQSLITKAICKNLIGKTISFETDDCGRIIKFNDLDKIKKQAKSFYKDFYKLIEKMSIVKEAKDQGFDVMKIAKAIDTEKMIDSYLEDIKLLFNYHGLALDTGENVVKEEATDTQYANETQSIISAEEDGSYSIKIRVENYIPQETIKEMTKNLLNSVSTNEVEADLLSDIDDTKISDGINTSIFEIYYLPNGWPYKVVQLDSNMIDDSGKAKMKLIFMTYYSFGN